LGGFHAKEHFAVALDVVDTAEPHHVPNLGIVLMMSMDVDRGPATLARHTNEATRL
jgi:hypothetical protein